MSIVKKYTITEDQNFVERIVEDLTKENVPLNTKIYIESGLDDLSITTTAILPDSKDVTEYPATTYKHFLLSELIDKLKVELTK